MSVPNYIKQIQIAVARKGKRQNILTGSAYAVRHAESTFNITFNQYLKGESEYNPYSDINQVDAQLSERGIEQCLESESYLPNLKVVYVSPMIRALQTAYLVFREHENFKNIEFKIEPYLREGLWVSCDIPSDIRPVLENFGKLFEKFDVDKLLTEKGSEPRLELWFLEHLEPDVSS